MTVTYEVAQRPDGSYGVKRSDSETVFGTFANRDEAQAGVDVGTWVSEAMGSPGGLASADAATTSPSVAGSAAGHTPGPWSSVDNSWDFSTIYDDNGAVVASVPINHLVTEDSQDRYEPIKEANARLIAASPCLLEALTELVEFADKMTGRVEPEYRQIAVARAIIAKARGHE